MTGIAAKRSADTANRRCAGKAITPQELLLNSLKTGERVSVKKAMVERDDMSVTELAKEIGYSRAHVSQVINGTMVPSANIKSAIESCLNLRA